MLFRVWCVCLQGAPRVIYVSSDLGDHFNKALLPTASSEQVGESNFELKYGSLTLNYTAFIAYAYTPSHAHTVRFVLNCLSECVLLIQQKRKLSHKSTPTHASMSFTHYHSHMFLLSVCSSTHFWMVMKTWSLYMWTALEVQTNIRLISRFISPFLISDMFD